MRDIMLKFYEGLQTMRSRRDLSADFLANPGSSSAGFYGHEAANATTGELNDQDYWWTKFDMMMLDLAIKQHQPEGRIAVDLASTGRRLDAGKILWSRVPVG